MIIPAIDLINGRVVRLFQGDYAQKTDYSVEPLTQLQHYAADGAQYLHLVDLDGAKDVTQRQLSVIRELAAKLPVPLQVGGGIRSRADVLDLLEAGVARVVIGSLAIVQPEVVEACFAEFGAERMVLALDVNINSLGLAEVATHGWQKGSGRSIESVIEYYLPLGLRHVLCTDIAKDGTMAGANVTFYQYLTQKYPDLHLQASGGVANLLEFPALRAADVKGVILGRALLEGQFTVKEAVSCWQNASSHA